MNQESGFLVVERYKPKRALGSEVGEVLSLKC